MRSGNLLFVLAAAALGGCEHPTQSMPVEPQARLRIERIGVIPDSIAYAGVRGIYVITDKKTGQEYIGISGIGIAETGSHPAGKTLLPDER